MERKSYVLVLALFAVLGLMSFAQSANVLLQKQERDNVPAVNLSAAELASLGDPFFVLVLKESAHITNLADLENLIQPDSTKRNVFVVSENIADTRRGQSRRSVLTFSGSHKGEILNSNLMLSIFFDSEKFSDTPSAIEAWGWDNHRSRYNYYKLDPTGTPDLRLSWKFRGSSDGVDLLSPFDRLDTCMACHFNGAPVMKELPSPWNNWHSFESQATYLLPTTPVGQRWPVADHNRLKGRLSGAESLELNILSAITQFNTRRINNALGRRDADGSIAIDGDGTARVMEGKRLLRSLFTTTEFNIISSRQKSGMHPFPNVTSQGPSVPVKIPNSFFLNTNLIGGGSAAQYVGLGIKVSQQFSDIAAIQPEEYKQLVLESAIQLGGRLGDADFAWLVPEPSHIDNDMVDQLMRRGIITPEFCAAVMLIDLEIPILSSDRESLLQFVPDTFPFTPIGPGINPLTVKRHPDELTTQLIALIQAAGPPQDSAAAKLVPLLQDQNPILLLQNSIENTMNGLNNSLKIRRPEPMN